MSEEKLRELKELDRKVSLIERRKQELQEQLEAEKELAKWYDQVLEESGFKRPRDFIKAAMRHFGIKQVNLEKTKSAAGVAGVKAAAGAEGGKRTRTKITPELRDQIKAALAENRSKNSVKDDFGVSYPVVKKIADGGYDNL